MLRACVVCLAHVFVSPDHSRMQIPMLLKVINTLFLALNVHAVRHFVSLQYVRQQLLLAMVHVASSRTCGHRPHLVLFGLLVCGSAACG